LADLGTLLIVIGCILLFFAVIITAGMKPVKTGVIVLDMVPVALIVGGAVLRFRMRDEGTHFWLCPGGVVWMTGEQVRFGAWKDVRLFQRTQTHVVKPGIRETQHTCGLALADSPTFRIAMLPAVSWLQQQVQEALIPLYLDRLARGETVELSPFRLSPRGLLLDKDEVAWGNVEKIAVGHNKVQVVPRHGAPWAHVPIGSMPLAAVFLPLAAFLANRQAAPDARPSGQRPPNTSPDVRQPGGNYPFDFG
jgi:hypothetical protein